MNNPRNPAHTALACLLFAALCGAQEYNPEKARDTFQKVCGACHAANFVMPARSKDQWQETIRKMTTLGAKGTDQEFATIIDYLMRRGAPANAVPTRGPARGGGRDVEAGAKDKHIVDDDAADRGRKVWAAECISCHGTQARGNGEGTNLIRSEIVLHDRYGNEIGPFLRKGHRLQSGHSGATLTDAQILDVSHFIHQRVYDTLRGSPIFHVQDVVTGDAKAGAAYFNGEGKCSTCHSPTGDLAGIAAKYEPAQLELRFISPRGGRGGANRPKLTLTVTPPAGPAVTGTPVVFDDFTVAIRDEQGGYHSWTVTPGLKVVKNDPYAAHDELLDKYTDKQMHDLLAYLVTLK
jgi:cytochrome c oxidase cbb3-type subunit III